MNRLALVVVMAGCSPVPESPDAGECGDGEPVACVELGAVKEPDRVPYRLTGLRYCAGGVPRVFACPGRHGGCESGRCLMSALDAGAACPAELAPFLSDCVGEVGETPASCVAGVVTLATCAKGTHCGVGPGDAGQFSITARCR